MNNVARGGVDVDVAFASGLRQVKNVPATASGEQVGDSGPAITELGISEPRPRRGVKAVLRPVARCVYRLAKPVVRPVLFRARRYLIDGLRLEIQQEIREASDATARHVQREVQSVSEATARLVQREFHGASEATARLVRREIREAVDATARIVQQEIREASAARVSDSEQITGALWPRLDVIEQYSAATARRVAINAGAGEVLVKTAVGFVLCGSSDFALLSSLLETGELEPGTRMLIQKHLRPGDVFVDVGANIGMHTLAAARAMRGQGKIFAFEPFDATVQMLRETMWMNGYSGVTEIHQAAVSNAAGSQQLFLGGTSGHHSLFALDSAAASGPGAVDVPVVRLDDVIPPGQRVDLIKIDVEGAELEAIEGGRSLIAHNPDVALIVEFGPSHLRRTGHTSQQWLDSFATLGLDYRVINASTGDLEEWSIEDLERAESSNLYFARPESPAWGRLA